MDQLITAVLGPLKHHVAVLSTDGGTLPRLPFEVHFHHEITFPRDLLHATDIVVVVCGFSKTSFYAYISQRTVQCGAVLVSCPFFKPVKHNHKPCCCSGYFAPRCRSAAMSL